MLKKQITFTDFNGEVQTATLHFNLTRAELIDMEYSQKEGSLSEVIKMISETNHAPTIARLFKEIILKSYGEKSADGLRFVKKDENGKSLSIKFEQSAAFDELYMELLSNPDAASDFVNQIVPKEQKTVAKSIAENNK